ncbi:MAG: ribulose-phosphate 3-epimerase [Oscillospiraceae bacterium]
MKTLVSASILGCDLSRLAAEIARCEAAGADWIHFDVMDGAFVNNISFGVPVLQAVRKVTALPLDVHLMISEPARFVRAFADAGADWITVHAEACSDLPQTLRLIRALGKKAGVTLKPATPLCFIEPVLELADLALVMSVEPGFGGQAFLPESAARVKALREAADARGLDLRIEVDGGISDKTAPLVKAAGADVLVSGSWLFAAENMAARVAALKA